MPMLELERILGLQASVSRTLFMRLRALAGSFQADVLHANSLFFQTSLAAALAQWASGVPLVTTAHIAGLEMLPGPARLPASGYERTAGRFILSRSSQLIAVSDSVAQHLHRLGVGTERITVVPNGVDLDRFRPRDHSSLPNDPPVIAFVGRLMTNKGPEVFMEALLALHRDGIRFKAVYLGDGPMRCELERRAMALQGAVDFRGHSHNVDAELRRADLLVRPSLTEGMPLSVLEAMASGVCVVASDIAGNRDLIKDGGNGVLVPVKQSQALMLAIRSLLQEPDRRRRLADAGHATAQQYSWDRTVAGTAAALKKALQTDAAMARSKAA